MPEMTPFWPGRPMAKWMCCRFIRWPQGGGGGRTKGSGQRGEVSTTRPPDPPPPSPGWGGRTLIPLWFSTTTAPLEGCHLKIWVGQGPLTASRADEFGRAGPLDNCPPPSDNFPGSTESFCLTCDLRKLTKRDLKKRNMITSVGQRTLTNSNTPGRLVRKDTSSESPMKSNSGRRGRPMRPPPPGLRPSFWMAVQAE